MECQWVGGRQAALSGLLTFKKPFQGLRKERLQMSGAGNGFYTFEPVIKAFLRTLFHPPTPKQNSWKEVGEENSTEKDQT